MGLFSSLLNPFGGGGGGGSSQSTTTAQSATVSPTTTVNTTVDMTPVGQGLESFATELDKLIAFEQENKSDTMKKESQLVFLVVGVALIAIGMFSRHN